jgi:WD40 repeat protein
VDVSEDFELYARTNEKGGCSIRRVADDVEVAQLPEWGEKVGAIFGGGRVLALHTGSSGRFQLWDLSGRDPRCPFEERDIVSFNFHPNGRLLGMAEGKGAIKVYEVATRKWLYQLEPKDPLPGPGLFFHPTEPFLAVASYFKPVVQVRDLRTGAVSSVTTPAVNSWAAWRPDGRVLWVQPGESDRIQEYAFDPTAPEPLRPTRTIEGPVQGAAHMAVNPAGDRFVTNGWSNTFHLFDAVSGQLLMPTPALPCWPSWPRLDRTGTRLAFAVVGDENKRLGLWSVAEGREYRYLLHTESGESRSQPAVHGRGRLAAIGRRDGFALFDLESGRELDHVRWPGGDTSAQFDGAGNLLTNGLNGFFRWRVRPDPADTGRLIVGPPEQLPFHRGFYPIAASKDGRVIAQAMFHGYGMSRADAGTWILHPNSPTPRHVDAEHATNWTSVSHDGRWVASAVNNGSVNVHEAATGQRVWQSPVEEQPYCCFSPDGRWLMTNVDGGRLYAAETWESGPRLGPGTPWDATSELAILGQPNGIYRLVELATGRELAKLEDQEQNTGPAAFSPDGTKLVIQARNGLRVWDLRRIRAELVEMGLDWDAPPFPPETKDQPPLQITLELGQFSPAVKDLVAQALALRAKGDRVGALAEFQKAHALAPDDANINHWLAWLLAICPDSEVRDPKQAVALGKKAVEAAPNDAMCVRALGIACYYAGDYQAAREALIRSVEMRQGSDGYDHFPLAMAHHRLGDKEKARQWYDRGVAWMAANKQPPDPEELAWFRADAEALLGIHKPSPDKTPEKKE